MKSSNKFSFNIVAYSILFLFLINIFAIAGGAIFYFQSMYNLSSKALEKRISITMDVEMKRLREVLVEYSFWDIGYERSVLSEDKAWVENNYGDYLLETYGLTFVLIIQNSDKILFSFLADNSPVMTKSNLIEYGIDQLMSQSRNVLSLTKDTGGYVCIGGEVYMLAVGPFVDENTEKPRPDNSYVVFGKKLENNYLDSISRLYDLPSLNVSSGTSPEKLSIIILDQPNCPEVRLTFDPPEADWAILSMLLPIITLLGVCTFGISWFLLNRHNHLRSMYEENLYELATRDSLTGAYSRREFFNLGQEAFRQQERNDQHLSVLMLDIDHFKSINDQHGHSIGDNNLKVFVKILNSCVRGNDIIGRVGGEEFAAILVNAEASEAYTIAERIRVQVEETSKTGRDSIVPMTVSIGVIHVRKGTTFEDSFKSADSLLYRAKSTGRNKVVTSEE